MASDKYETIEVYHRRGLVDRADGRVRKIRDHEESHGEIWARCVKEGKLLVMRRNEARLRLVELAEEVCEIVHGGGGHWSGFKDVYNAKVFAAEIGIHHKTLLNWMGIKKTVYDHINPKYHSKFNWTAAERARRHMPKTVRGLGELDRTIYYEKELNKPASKKVSFLITRYISNLRSNLNKCDEANLTELSKDLEALLQEINGRIKGGQKKALWGE